MCSSVQLVVLGISSAFVLQPGLLLLGGHLLHLFLLPIFFYFCHRVTKVVNASNSHLFAPLCATVRERSKSPPPFFFWENYALDATIFIAAVCHNNPELLPLGFQRPVRSPDWHTSGANFIVLWIHVSLDMACVDHLLAKEDLSRHCSSSIWCRYWLWWAVLPGTTSSTGAQASMCCCCGHW